MVDEKIKLAADAVVFTILHKELQILLIKRKNHPFKGMYALPGGYVKTNESLNEAAQRELEEETGVKNIFLKQMRAYGKVDRDPRGRIVSVAYLSLINPHQRLHATTDAEKAKWSPIDDLPKLAFDHQDIINYALKTLRFEIQTTNIAYQILPRKFTLTQLQSLYEVVLGKKFDKRNFRKRVHEFGILKETKEQWREGAHRPAVLYEFKDQQYKPLAEKLSVFL